MFNEIFPLSPSNFAPSAIQRWMSSICGFANGSDSGGIRSDSSFEAIRRNNSLDATGFETTGIAPESPGFCNSSNVSIR